MALEVQVKDIQPLLEEVARVVRAGNIIALAGQMGLDASEPIARGKVLRAMVGITKDSGGGENE